MYRLLNHIRMRNKMLVIYFLSVFLPIILTNVLFYNAITDNVRNQRIRDIDRTIEQIGNDFRGQVDNAVGLSSFFYADLSTNEILDRDFANAADYLEAYDSYLRRMLNNYTPLSLSLQNVTIYVDNTTLLHSGNIGYLSDELRKEKWYRQALTSAKSHPIFIRTETEDGRFEGFSLIRKLDYFSGRLKKEKLVKIDFKTIDIGEIFSNLNMQGAVYLLNPSGEIEYTTDPAVDWQAADKTLFSSLRSNDWIEFSSRYSGVSYLEGWSIVGTVDEDEVIREVQKSRDFILVSACIMMILPTFVIVVVTRSFNIRIVRILRHMKKVRSQNFEIIQASDFRDEIGQLSLEFNRMILQIKSLIDDVYKAEIQKKSLELERRKAQLNALQSQINPHFLFNALETIRMRSLLKDENETATMIHSMAKIFRSSLTWNKDMITVREELEFIVCFLEIQKYRFEDRIDYHIEVEPEAYACKIPKMLFLPFVENASIHGLEPLKHGGRIDITIRLAGRELIFMIRDNGTGMNAKQIGKLYSYLETNEVMGERIGIQNVIYRTKIIYGAGFRFSVDSAPGEGTGIELHIPQTPEPCETDI
ncbi:sensor histidine kinase [Paenibacillus sp. NFR01]|uniref:sensor histidine kinase n=1 Tax=Paenibacillus sp. NFR01 TaxID=1566279 RepID=UPI0008ABBC7C|nr:sensor histidine kinase [Paenibacillus sp. NFR01]SEU20579.1 two-component system, sensor histidine kinase YesM [Paenibacillus sp. NFR01]